MKRNFTYYKKKRKKNKPLSSSLTKYQIVWKLLNNDYTISMTTCNSLIYLQFLTLMLLLLDLFLRIPVTYIDKYWHWVTEYDLYIELIKYKCLFQFFFYLVCKQIYICFLNRRHFYIFTFAIALFFYFIVLFVFSYWKCSKGF